VESRAEGLRGRPGKEGTRRKIWGYWENVQGRSPCKASCHAAPVNQGWGLHVSHCRAQSRPLLASRPDGTFRAVWGNLRPRDPRGRPRGTGVGLPRRKGRPRIPAPAPAPSLRVRGPADAALFCRAPDAALRGRPDLFQARGPAAHGGPQDQQCDRPGAPRAQDGKEADHRRDGRRPARRRHGLGVRQVRPRMRRLHGRRGHGAAGAQRVPDAPHGGRGPQRRGGPEDAEGGHQRGDARLGDERAERPITSSVRPTEPIPTRRWSATSTA
jgi:hypothetical protein